VRRERTRLKAARSLISLFMPLARYPSIIIAAVDQTAPLN
jgi:hypothetical protein